MSTGVWTNRKEELHGVGEFIEKTETRSALRDKNCENI